MQYKIYSDRIEYEGGLFSMIKKEIGFDHVKEVLLYQGAVQKKYNLGSIYVATAAIGEISGLCICNIENPEQVYDRVQSLLTAAKALSLARV